MTNLVGGPEATIRGSTTRVARNTGKGNAVLVGIEPAK